MSLELSSRTSPSPHTARGAAQTHAAHGRVAVQNHQIKGPAFVAGLASNTAPHPVQPMDSSGGCRGWGWGLVCCALAGPPRGLGGVVGGVGWVSGVSGPEGRGLLLVVWLVCRGSSSPPICPVPVSPFCLSVSLGCWSCRRQAHPLGLSEGLSRCKGVGSRRDPFPSLVFFPWFTYLHGIPVNSTPLVFKGIGDSPNTPPQNPT